MKNIIMIAACIVVAASQTFILMWFLKRLKKIEVAFWGASAEQARKKISEARAEERSKAEEESSTPGKK
jgi:hypothetical protein